MSEHINPAPPEASNFEAVSINYVADALDVSREEAKRIVRRQHDECWLESPVICMSASVLPSAEDGIKKLRERHPDLV